MVETEACTSSSPQPGSPREAGDTVEVGGHQPFITASLELVTCACSCVFNFGSPGTHAQFAL